MHLRMAGDRRQGDALVRLGAELLCDTGTPSMGLQAV